jgi:LuxR family maltose regulon positive regulatory protein
LILVSAPAGFGKTTLLAQWAEHTSLPVAWVTVREQTTSARPFFSLVTEAVQWCFAGAAPLADTAHLLQPGVRARHRYIAATLIRELHTAPAEFILIVDDYHLVSHEAIRRFMTELAQDARPPLHLILSSRVDPSLPLDRMRAGAELAEIRASALQFTPEEVEAFLATSLGVETSRKIAAEATRRTEGWITGLRLAILSFQSDPHPDTFLALLEASGGRHVMGYLLAEVLTRQPQHIQDFLLRTSVLDQLRGELCDAVVGARRPIISGSAALEQIDHLNLFLTRLDDQEDWYRYHALFQELLQHELLGRFGSAEVSALHRRASEWYAQRGMVDDALRHAFRSDDLEAAVRLVESQLENTLNAERWHDLQHWLKLLPASLIRARPALLVALAAIHSIQQRLSAIPPLLRHAEELMRAQPELCDTLPATVLRGIADVMWAQDHYWKGEGAEGLRAVERALAALPASSTFARGSGVMYSALLQQLVGDGEAATEMLERLVDTDESAAVTARALLALCLISRQAGRLDRCHASAERLLAHAQRHQLLLDINWARYFLGWAAYERNQLDEAREHFRAVSEERYVANAISASDSLSALALTYQAHGRATEAEKALQDLNHYAVELNHSFAMGAVAALRARLAVAREDPPLAQSMLPWLEHPSSPPTPMLWLLAPSLVRARILLALGDGENVRAAVERLGELERFAQATHDVWRHIAIRGMQAIAYAQRGRRAQALALLRQTLASAQPQGFVRTLADCGPALADLLRELRAEGQTGELAPYVDAILDACAARQPPLAEPAAASEAYSGQASLASPLTTREIEVLLMLDQRYSNKEIAAALVITPFTVRSHTRNIYRKLDVGDRREAVLKARNMGILGAGVMAQS